MILNYLPRTVFCHKTLLLLFFSFFSFNITSQETFIVNTTADSEDINLNDNLCKDLNGNCSLRAAIQNANKTTETDRIHFNISGIGPHEIVLKDNLPEILETIILDATTQSGYSIERSQMVIKGNLLTEKFDDNNEKVLRTVFHLSENSSGSQISGFNIVQIESTYSVGIYARGTGEHKIFENKIGCNSDGSEVSQNKGYGMYFQKSHNNVIGNIDREKRNIISGNRIAIAIDYANNNQILNNFIGTDYTGENFLGNGDGILTWKNRLEEISNGNLSSYNIITNNLIAGGYRGIMIHGNYNLIENNFIGTDVTGEKAFPISAGILLSEGNFNEIGGENGNLVSGNETGITIYSSENYVTNNLIGINKNGNLALPNEFGIILHTKVPDYDARKNVVEFNVISGNSEKGIWITLSHENNLSNNIIGLGDDGSSAIPNNIGIEIDYSNANQVLNNTIAYNDLTGVLISRDSWNNKITKNSLYENKFIGIDLGKNGISNNDFQDRDYGPNNLQNFPELITANFDGSSLELFYKIDSDPAYSTYPLTIEIFKSDGNRQGKQFIGTFQLTEKDLPKGRSKRNLSHLLTLSTNIILTEEDLILATATDAAGNTSEFSPEIAVSVTGSCTQIWYADSDGDNFGDATISLEKCTQPPGYVQDNTDCDDSDNTVYPGAVDDTVDGIDQNCDGIDGPVTSCTGSDLITVSEVCSTATNVIWEITNPGSCQVAGRWELRKNSSTGDSSGKFSLVAGETIQITSGVVSKGKTQIVVYWNDSTGTELNTSSNASGITCSGSQSAMASSPETEFFVSPNPVTEGGIGIYFTAVNTDSILNAVIYNSSGQQMASESFSLKSGTTSLIWDLDHSSWIEGVYILNVTINNDTYQSQFIK